MPDKTICFFNSSKTWGGGEKWHLDNALFLARKGYRVIVLTNIQSKLATEIEKYEEIKLIKIKVSNFSFINPFRIIQLKSVLKKINPKTIIINLPSDLKLIGVTSIFYKISQIIYRRGSAIPIKNTFLNRFLFKNVITGIIANSEATKNTILQKNQKLYPKDKIEVIYNGIFICKDEALDRTFNREIILGHIGRFSREKNQEFLIRLAEELKSREVPFKLILGGTGTDFEKISRLVSLKNLTDQVILPGFISNTQSFFRTIDVFLLPSFWEGFGYVTVEAMACKKPVIAFNVGSNPEIILHESTGFLIQPFNLELFAERVKFFYNNPPEIKSFGIRGRERATKHFNIKNSYNHIEAYLNKL